MTDIENKLNEIYLEGGGGQHSWESVYNMIPDVVAELQRLRNKVDVQKECEEWASITSHNFPTSNGKIKMCDIIVGDKPLTVSDLTRAASEGWIVLNFPTDWWRLEVTEMTIEDIFSSRIDPEKMTKSDFMLFSDNLLKGKNYD